MGPEFPVIYELLDIWWIQAHITFNGVSILNRSSASVNVPAMGIPEDQMGDIHNTGRGGRGEYSSKRANFFPDATALWP